jgi:mycofactocin system glycosyltransferase
VLALDHSAKLLNGGQTLIGGDPPRALRLSPTGAAVLAHLCTSGAGASAAERKLARTLTDAGLAHPQPGPATATTASNITVVVPVRDRPDALDRCLAAMLAPTPATENRRADGPRVVVVDDGSRDARAVAEICERHGASVMRLPYSRGPAPARNAALAHLDTPLVAFLDSDCIPTPDWISALAEHFADPLVAAVAPRVQGHAPPAAGPVGRFAAARSPLDLGAYPARVVPGGRVSYVPTAALLVRGAALGDGFDQQLRFGEDVDLVWRLHDAGWRIRYDPAATIRHAEPGRWRTLAARRFQYGTSAAPLAARHAQRLAPLVIAPTSAAAVALALAGRPRLAASVLTAQAAVTTRRLHPAGVPPTEAARWTLRSASRTLLATGHAATTLTPVLLLLAAAASRRARLPATIVLATPPLKHWTHHRPPLDPLRWTALSFADDAAYGAGVWTGSLRAHSTAALRPLLSRSQTSTSKRARPA